MFFLNLMAGQLLTANAQLEKERVEKIRSSVGLNVNVIIKIRSLFLTHLKSRFHYKFK